MRIAAPIAGLIALVAWLCCPLEHRPHAWTGHTPATGHDDPAERIAQAGVPGAWEGTVDMSGVSLKIGVVVTPAGGGLSAVIELPLQDPARLPLRNLTLDASIRFELPTGAAVAGVMTPWWKFFVTFDPATALARTTCPVLAISSGNDVQVPRSLHRDPL